jgi:hypothetical protein
VRYLGLGLGLAVLTASAVAGSEPTRTARGEGETCSDALRNGPESDVDCGGDCRACGHGRACIEARDCASGLCAQGRCAERPYHRGDAIPPGYEVARSRHDAAASVRLAGALFLGVSFGAAYATAVATPRFTSELYVPLAGPWLAVGNFQHPANRTLLVSDGAIQAAGAILLAAGVLGAGRQLVRTETPLTASRDHRRRITFDGSSVTARF